MNPASVDSRILEVLHRASNLELFELGSLIDRMLADPRRVLEVRKQLHLGQTVRFMDWRDARMHSGRIVGLKDRQLAIHDEGTRTTWTVPYVAVEPPDAGAGAGAAKPAAQAESPPPAPRATRSDFRCGEKVAFEDKYLNTVVGTIVRINQRTATIDPGNGTTWRVGFGLLRHVLDV